MKLTELKVKLDELEKYFSEISDSVNEKIDSIESVGKPIKDAKHMTVIKFSDLQANNFNLSPRTYCASAQIEAIKFAISKCNGNMFKVRETLQQMVEDKFIKRNNDKIILNHKTLEKLQEIINEM